ncbi:hypothetical protein EFP6CSP_17560 [Enterococcus faecium]|nr:hypothetical protein EFP6CSP_17560 [Enterococcus faecium]
MYLVTSLIKYVSKTEKKSVMTLRLFIKLTQKEEANTFLSGMIEKWKKNYPKVTQSLIENQDLLTFL